MPVHASPRLSSSRSHSSPCHPSNNGTGYRLEGQTTDSTLQLQRFDVWDPAAKVVVHSGGSTKPTVQGPPDVRYFKGSLAGAPGSTVVLAVDPAGGVSGVATHGQERWALSRPALLPVAAAAGVAPAGLSSRKAARSGGAAAGRPPFHCGASDLQPQQPQRAQQASGLDGAARKLLAVGWGGGKVLTALCMGGGQWAHCRCMRRGSQALCLGPYLPACAWCACTPLCRAQHSQHQWQ